MITQKQFKESLKYMQSERLIRLATYLYWNQNKTSYRVTIAQKVGEHKDYVNSSIIALSYRYGWKFKLDGRTGVKVHDIDPSKGQVTQKKDIQKDKSDDLWALALGRVAI